MNSSKGSGYQNVLLLKVNKCCAIFVAVFIPIKVFGYIDKKIRTTPTYCPQN